MESFKLITSDSYDSLFRYLSLITQITNLEYPLAWVADGKDKYLVTKVAYDENDYTYAIAYNRGFHYGLYGVQCNEDSFSYIDNNKGYRVEKDGACIENLDNGFKHEIAYYQSIEKEPKDVYLYMQIDPLNKRELHLNYVIDGLNNHKMAIPYLSERNSKFVEIVTKKLLLNQVKRFVLDVDNYYKFLRLTNEAVLLIPKIGVMSKEEMDNYVRSLGFLSRVPRDLTDLYSNGHYKTNTLKRVVETYKRNTNL